MESVQVLTKSAPETKKLGALLVREIDGSPTSAKIGALVISLEGNLGAGKTTFTQGFAKRLGVKEIPRSPTFVIIQIYPIRDSVNKTQRSWKNVDFKNFIHVDAYRLESKDFKTLNWEDFISDPKNLILVEWGNKIKNILPKNSLRIIFEHGKNSNHRLIKIIK